LDLNGCLKNETAQPARLSFKEIFPGSYAEMADSGRPPLIFCNFMEEMVSLFWISISKPSTFGLHFIPGMSEG